MLRTKTIAEECEELKAQVAYWRGIAEGIKGQEIVDYPDDVARATPTSRLLFRILERAEGRMLTCTAIFDAIYGTRPECDQPNEVIIKVYVTKLRKFLRTYTIKTHWGQGYSLHKNEVAG